MTGMYCLKDLLKLVEVEAAQELRLEPGKAPEISVAGHIRVLNLPPITADEVAALFRGFAPSERLEEVNRCGDVRFNFSFQHSGSFRVIASLKSEDMSLNLRRLSD